MDGIWDMNLQLFAEEGTESDAGIEQSEETATVESGAPEKMFSAAEVARLIQSEADKRVTAALSKQKREYEKKLSLSGLSEQERSMAEKDQRITELEEELQELRQIKIKQEVVKELSARGMDAAFADVIQLTDDEPEMKGRLDEIERTFKAAVENAVRARISGGTPPAKGTSATAMSKEQFRKMSIAEQADLYRKSPEIYQKMTE